MCLELDTGDVTPPIHSLPQLTVHLKNSSYYSFSGLRGNIKTK